MAARWQEAMVTMQSAGLKVETATDGDLVPQVSTAVGAMLSYAVL
jgi:fructose-1,6-bisphosphatase/sedoheptulose 1,7-bisphosphatase-like protein